MIRRAAVPLLVILATLLLVSSPGTAAAPRERRVETVTIATTGWGHGVGLSQYGARNRAAAGQSYRTIVQHYYPGTSFANAYGNLRVLITADTSRDVVVLARPGLKAASLGAHKTWRLPSKYRGKAITLWRIQPQGKRSRISFRVGSWHVWRSAKGDAQFSAGSQPTVLVTPKGRAAYRGALRSTSTNASGTSRDTVNVLPVDSYLRGVVPSEVPASWPAAAVRAQAVAARTYAIYERRAHRTRYYDLCDTAHCQVYRGFKKEHPNATAAVRATARKVLMYGGRPAFTQFSASNGGWSVAGQFPYLRAREDTFDHGIPGDPKGRDFSAAAITRNWPGIGDLVSIDVTARDPADQRVTEVTVVGTNFTQTVSGAQLKSWLDLNSTLFTITYL